MIPATPLLRLELSPADPVAIARVLAAWPCLRATLALELPLDEAAPEEILSLCLRAGVTVARSRVVRPMARSG
jgi:hypothetical protein